MTLITDYGIVTESLVIMAKLPIAQEWNLGKTINISNDTYEFLVRKTQGKESFDDTLKRLLGTKRGRPPKPREETPAPVLER